MVVVGGWIWEDDTGGRILTIGGYEGEHKRTPENTMDEVCRNPNFFGPLGAKIWRGEVSLSELFWSNFGNHQPNLPGEPPPGFQGS